MLILMTMTITAYNVSADGERIRSAARQVQSYLEGARDRAIFRSAQAGKPMPVGVRFLLDKNDPTTASSMIFVGVPEPLTAGIFQIERPSSDGVTPTTTDAVILRGERIGIDHNSDGTVSPTHWRKHALAGLIGIGTRVEIGSSKHTISNIYMNNSPSGYSYPSIPANDPYENDPDEILLQITPPFEAANPQTDIVAQDPGTVSYEMTLYPSVLPNQEPIQLPQGIVVDLDYSQVPATWKASNAAGTQFGYSSQMDIIFSPRGSVAGAAASRGVIHLLLNDVADTERQMYPLNRDFDTNNQIDEYEANQGGKILITIFTRTGHISVHPLFNGDLDGNGVIGSGEAEDLYYYAEVGEVAQ